MDRAFVGVERRVGDDVDIVFDEKRNQTFDNTTYDQLAEMTSEVRCLVWYGLIYYGVV